MPHVAAAAPLLFGHALYGGGLLGASIFGVSVASIAATAALSGASYVLQKNAAKKALRGSGGLSPEADKQLVKQALPLARRVYGTALVGGALFFAERSVDKDWIYFGIILADQECDGIEEYRMGEKVVNFDENGAATSLPFFTGTNTYLYKSVRNGTDDQLIDPLLAADFPTLPASFRQRGLATVVFKIWSPLTISNSLRTTLYGNTGQPNPIVKLRGAKVFDPRDPSQSQLDKSTWKWSRTPSLCAADVQVLSRERGGFGSSWDEIDLDALKKAADDDDCPVPRKDGTTEPRYTCDGVINLDGTAPSEQISKILTANAGSRVTSNGKYVFLSGVPRDPVWTLTDNSARGGMNVVLQSTLQDRINIVTCQFVSSDREYQAQEGPELRNAEYITDDGVEMPLSVELLFTNSHTMAQRLCNLYMEDSRLGRRIARRENIEAILLDAADVVNVETSVLSAASGKYIIETISVSDSPLEFEVSLKGYDPAIYNWLPDTQEQDFTIAPVQLS
jgi:hypothetical protein